MGEGTPLGLTMAAVKESLKKDQAMRPQGLIAPGNKKI